VEKKNASIDIYRCIYLFNINTLSCSNAVEKERNYPRQPSSTNSDLARSATMLEKEAQSAALRANDILWLLRHQQKAIITITNTESLFYFVNLLS
jgi:hypothetical protein